MINSVVLALASGVVATFLGIVFALLVRVKEESQLSVVLGFSAGFMLAMVVFDMLPCAIEQSNVVVVGISLVISLVMIALMAKFIDGKVQSKAHARPDYGTGIIILLAMSLHDFPEGIALGALETLEMSTAFTILLASHNVIEGVAIGATLRASKFENKSVIISGLLAGAPTVLGAIIGYGVSGISETFLSISLAIASGAMLFVVFKELLKDVYRDGEKSWTGVLVGTIIGMITVFVV
ncbi:MAG: ZIP family metal transporter [Christensenellales bacterium]